MSYSMTAGEVLQSKVIAKLRQPINSVKISKDIIKNNAVNDGTVSGGVTIEDGAMVFDGTGYVETSDILLTGTDTISFWAKNNNFASSSYWFRLSEYNGRNGFNFASDSAKFYYGWRLDNNSINRRQDWVYGDSATYRDWNYYSIVIDSVGGEHSLYINGDLKSTISLTYHLDLNNNPNHFIISYTSNYFNGSIDNVQIYNRALSQSEITEIYNAGKDAYSPIRDNLIAEYSGKDFTGTESVPLTILDTNNLIPAGSTFNGGLFEVTKDDTNWVEVTPDTKYTFASGSNDDELKYRVTASDNVVINKISIDINKP